MVEITPTPLPDDAVVAWLRQVSPYFQHHRGRVFVVHFGGEAVAAPGFEQLIGDLVLLAAVGIRLVVVFDARAQIEQRLAAQGLAARRVGPFRVTDAACMAQVREVVGAMRLEIESAFSFGTRGGPFAGAASKVASGNFVTARPVGIIEGVDLGLTGVVRSIDGEALRGRLDRGEIVLLPPLGYSPTGELYNLVARDLAVAVASELGAAKLILIDEPEGIRDARGRLHRQLTVREAREVCDTLSPESVERELLEVSIRACELGVERVHLISRHTDGALLRELFTRDGIGTLVSSAPFDRVRPAKLEDVAGILELVRPLEAEGVLVPRSRELLEVDIERFIVMVRESTIVACGALYPFPEHARGEIACIAVHPDYRGGQFGDVLLDALERRAREAGLDAVFVLTTQAAQWFAERGYLEASLDSLPVDRRELYNYERNSAVLVKTLRARDGG